MFSLNDLQLLKPLPNRLTKKPKQPSYTTDKSENFAQTIVEEYDGRTTSINSILLEASQSQARYSNL